MRKRILLCDAAGNPLHGIDAHGADVATRFVAANVAALRARGIDPLVIEYDPVGSSDDANAAICALHQLRPEIRTQPDGRREVIDVHHRDRTVDVRSGAVTKAGSARSIARALRVLHAPDDIVNLRTKLRGTP